MCVLRKESRQARIAKHFFNLKKTNSLYHNYKVLMISISLSLYVFSPASAALVPKTN